jgi:hypothetical protein
MVTTTTLHFGQRFADNTSSQPKEWQRLNLAVAAVCDRRLIAFLMAPMAVTDRRYNSDF